MPIYIYGLHCPVADTIRYVGKSVDPKQRFRAHVSAALRGAAQHHTGRWLRRLIGEGLQPQLVILHEVAEGEDWQDIERAFIAGAERHGWSLTNSTAGGEGLDYRDPDARAAYIANLSAALKKLWNEPERRRQQSERAAKLHADPEVSARRVASMRDVYRDPAMRAQASEVAIQINARAEVKAAKSAKARAHWADVDGRARRMAAIDSEKLSAAAKARWADPVKGAEARAGHLSPERRAKIAEAARRRATPEYRAMMAEKTRLSWEKRREREEG